MSKMIQVRNVPDSLHRALKARAAMAGMSLSDYLLAEIREIAEKPTLVELRERLHARKPVSSRSIPPGWCKKSAKYDDRLRCFRSA